MVCPAGPWRAVAAPATMLLAVGALAGCGGATTGTGSGQTVRATAPVARTVAPAIRVYPTGPTTPGSGKSPTPTAHSGSPAPGASAASPAAHGAPPPAHPVPASFQVAPGAPSDEQVRRDLQQMERIQRAQNIALTAAAGSLLNLLPWEQEPKNGRQVSVASVFRDYGLGIACGGVLAPTELGVAHKTAPCGTMISFRYGGRVLRIPVIDRGPYIQGREWDLTGAAADALGFPGLGQIEWSAGALPGRRINVRPGSVLTIPGAGSGSATGRRAGE